MPKPPIKFGRKGFAKKEKNWKNGKGGKERVIDTERKINGRTKKLRLSDGVRTQTSL